MSTERHLLVTSALGALLEVTATSFATVAVTESKGRPRYQVTGGDFHEPFRVTTGLGSDKGWRWWRRSFDSKMRQEIHLQRPKGGGGPDTEC